MSLFANTILRRTDSLSFLGQPVVDLWVGGPNADGRGLNATNGGYSPMPGLSITSPSSSTSSSTVRFLRRGSDGVWRDKRAGELLGIGGARDTGSGLSYLTTGGAPLGGVLPRHYRP
ncbi:MAG: hypothetical protein NZ518_02330 [Dehalococcoidia bacterium]|nr:hypothetical protein [Dehalococcoidia bacterium]